MGRLRLTVVVVEEGSAEAIGDHILCLLHFADLRLRLQVMMT